MKKLIYVLAISMSLTAWSQVKTPQPSLASKLIQTVGLTDVTITYSRPSMNGREIMGALVPYGEIWRTGANQNTVISFSDVVSFGDQELPAGDYAIYTQPGDESWDVYFYNDTSNWGTPSKWDDTKISAQVTTVPLQTETILSFTIWISDLHNNGASLNIGWENTYITLPFGVPTIAKATASIDEVLKNDPKHRDFYNAAVYFLQENQDLNKAKEWISKAIAKNDQEAYWYFRQQSLILAGLNERDEAIEAAKKSLELATKAGNKDYVRLNTISIEEWSK